MVSERGAAIAVPHRFNPMEDVMATFTQVRKAPISLRILVLLSTPILSYGGGRILQGVYGALMGRFYLPTSDIVFGGLVGVLLVVAALLCFVVAIRGR